jgi:pimeloyl-ACP methyl ester carboxylesterase
MRGVARGDASIGRVAVEFAIPVAGGSLVGWESGQGVPLLVLHGGPLSDYTEPLVGVLPAGLRTLRYQQRGLPPSTEAGPFDVQTHVADAIAVLDGSGCEQVRLLGHSWGGHLAFHIAVARPDRVLGVLGVDALGAVPDGGGGRLARTSLPGSPAPGPRARGGRSSSTSA